jgi:hypothetical protein
MPINDDLPRVDPVETAVPGKRNSIAKPAKRRLVITEVLGFSKIDVFVDTEECGGNFTSFNSKPSSLPSMVIGLNQDAWWRCLAILQHEAWECVLAQSNLRYELSGGLGNSSGGYCFWMTHEQFTEVCAQAAYFLARVESVVATAWHDYDRYTVRRNKLKRKDKSVLLNGRISA